MLWIVDLRSGIARLQLAQDDAGTVDGAIPDDRELDYAARFVDVELCGTEANVGRWEREGEGDF